MTSTGTAATTFGTSPRPECKERRLPDRNSLLISPVRQVAKVELGIKMKTAKSLGLTVSAPAACPRALTVQPRIMVAKTTKHGNVSSRIQSIKNHCLGRVA